MVRVTLCLWLLLLFLVRKQSDAVSDRCNELLGGGTEITELPLKDEEGAGQCLVSGCYIVQVSSLRYGHMQLYYDMLI
jgi:hypothetical protein